MLGMTLLSKQTTDIFDLYFFGNVKEPLSVNNIECVENREWLWQREETLIELQWNKMLSHSRDYYVPSDQDYGWQGVDIMYENQNKIVEKNVIVRDPNGYRFNLCNRL